MEYLSVSARFLFFNGKERYTVEYAYGLNSWYVFKNDETSDSVYNKKQKLRLTEINGDTAEDILYEYLDVAGKQN